MEGASPEVSEPCSRPKFIELVSTPQTKFSALDKEGPGWLSIKFFQPDKMNAMALQWNIFYI